MIIVVAVVLALLNIDVFFPSGESRPLEEELKTLIETTPVTSYRDPDFGFTVRYPAFFRQEKNDGEDGYVGFARFSYWHDSVHIVLLYYATLDKENNTPDTKAKLLLADGHARIVEKGNDWFVIAGELYENGCRIDGYSYLKKYVRKGGFWLACSLLYPDACSQSLQRMFKMVEEFENEE